MSLLFVHDTPFRIIDDVVYGRAGALDDKVLKRYLNIFEKVDIYSRMYVEDSVKNGYQKITLDNLHFFSSFTMKKKDLIQKVKDSENIIVRLPSINGLKVLKIARKFNKKYMIEMVACPWDLFWNHSFKGKLVAPFFYFMNKYECKKAETVLYVTEKFLQSRYPTKGNEFACSDVEMIDFGENRLEKRKNKISNMENLDSLVFGTLANVDIHSKAQERVIKALGYIKRTQNKKYYYRLAGSGNPKFLKMIAIKENVEDQVIFDGGIHHDKINDWLDEIDIYIQPSKQEGLPRALIEAMGNALPCIGSETGGIPELLDKKYIFPNNSKISRNIASIISIYTKEDLLKQAESNFNKAKEYSSVVLEKKRKDFYISFKNM